MGQTFWDKKPQVLGPSPGLVQKHFVANRLADLRRKDPVLLQKVADVITKHPLLAHLRLQGDGWVAVYEKINKSLQAAELTIGFKATSWFADENRYDSYTQIYERNIQADGTAILGDGIGGDAATRSRIDDQATFPAVKPGGPAHRGLRPGVQGMDRVMTRMRFGEGASAPLPGPDGKPQTDSHGQTVTGLVSKNPYFNPHTKQVFAALNYGRRPHGSSISYGDCFLVLNPKLKLNALYFGVDTYYLFGAGAQAQVPYDNLASVLAAPGTKPKMVEAIIKSCYFGTPLPDTKDHELLMEAHIFSALPFAGNLMTVVLPLSLQDTVYSDNAKKFAAKHGAKVHFTVALK